MGIITSIPWNDGYGEIKVESTDNPNIIKISSTSNEAIEREQTITFVTDGNNPVTAKLKVVQNGLRELFITADNQILTDADGKPFTVLKS